MKSSRLLALGLLAWLAGLSWAEPADDPPALRRAVLAAKDGEGKAAAYRAYFGRVGRAGLAALTKDEDTGVALQAAWEAHAKAVKRRPPLGGRADDIYDPVELTKFVAFLTARTKAPVPDWWAKGVTDVDLFPGEGHAFVGGGRAAGPKTHRSRAGPAVPAGTGLERKGDRLVYTAGGRAVEFPADLFDEPLDLVAGAVGEKMSAVAGATDHGGFRYRLAGFGGRGGRPAWSAEVWGSGRTMALGAPGFHWVEVVERDGTVSVFGAEVHGMYLEAFDPATGASKFRFCTCYWFHPSEAWGRK